LRSARWAHSRSTLPYGSDAEKSHVLLNASRATVAPRSQWAVLCFKI
jgi:hypothetical protein